MVLVWLLIAVFLALTGDDRQWSSGNFQSERKARILRGSGDLCHELTAKMHRKHGFMYDPWWPELREMCIEGDIRTYGKSYTELAERKYGLLRENGL